MSLGRLLIFAGLMLLGLGVIVSLISRTNLPLGRLPGDIIWRGKNTTIYFPWVTCLLLSLLLTFLFWLFGGRR
jgi:hypothetical protein